MTQIAPASLNKETEMSDLSVTIHNFESLLAGKSTFSEFAAGEVALIKENVASLPAAVQPGVSLIVSSFETGVSALVGLGETALGPILAESTATQATTVLNLLSAAGVPTTGPLSIAELAVLTQLINGLKAGLDHIGLKIVAPTPAA